MIDADSVRTAGRIGAPKTVVNALTIDVEEHFQVHNFTGAIGRETWDWQPSRVVTNTARLLHI
ncbi:MAG TPA: hypothetical protein VIC87_15680, partial [Vicinamibacteria bacterium]